MKCQKCGAELPDNAKFCGSCGSQVLHTSKPKKKSAAPLIAALIAMILVVVAVVGVVLFIKSRIGSAGKIITYYKDRQILLKKADKPDSDPFVLTDFSSSVDESGSSIPDDSIQFTSDYRYVYYPENYSDGDDNESSNYTLMKQKPFSGKPDQVAETVHQYKLLDNDTIIYQNYVDDLYLLTDGKKIKISSNVYEYSTDQKNSCILWATENEDYEENEEGENETVYTYDIYSQAISSKGERQKLVSDADYYSLYEDAAVALKGGDLYYINKGNECDVIANDVSEYCQRLKDGTLVYTKDSNNGEILDYSDWVNDPYYDQDQEEPEYNYEDNTAWDEWSKRENIRGSLYDMSPVSMASLYVFKDGKESKIADNAAYDYVSAANVFHFYIYDMEHFKKVEMDDLMYMDEDYSSLYYDAMDAINVSCIYADGKVVSLKTELSSVTLDGDGQKGYGMVYDDNDDDDTSVGTLYSFDISSKTDGSLNKVAEEVNSILYAHNKNVYYLKDSNEEYIGTLYCNDKKIADSVISVIGEWDSNLYYYIQGQSMESFNGGETKRVADDIGGYGFINEQEEEGFLILHDMNSKKYLGTLSLCNGKGELTTVDEDVSGFKDQIYFEN